MNKRYPTIAGLAVGVFLLAGCAAGVTAPLTVQPAASHGPAAQATTSHAAATPASTTPKTAAQTPGSPPAAAAMVCSQEVKTNVTNILGLSAAPKTTDSWNGTAYSCSYALPDGTFAMSVQVFPTNQAAITGAKTMAESLGAAPIKGLSNLGLPGYQADNGTVVFAKDNFVLHVDATKLVGTVGVNHVTPEGFAYQMATTILACWSEH